MVNNLSSDYDYIIIGSGISSLMFIFKALIYEPSIKILVIEAGKDLDMRKCPIINAGECKKCKVCDIMSGISGAGAFSDAKFNITNEYGGWITDYISENIALEYMNELDGILMQCDSNRDYKIYHPDNNLIHEAYKHELNLLRAHVRHFGTDGIYRIMSNLMDNIKRHENIHFLTSHKVNHNDIDIYNKQVLIGDRGIYFNQLIFAVGRSGISMFKDFCIKNNIPIQSNQVDIGVRVEVPRFVCEEVSEKIYEPKIHYFTKKHKCLVRTFCFNSGGEVITENTNGILTVNGHSKSKESGKTENSNFAILSTHNFTEPFNEPIEYLQNIAKLSNMLGGGKIISQLFGDLISGRRSTDRRLAISSIRPTLKSHSPGDLSLVMPATIMNNIIEMIYQLDKFMPGIANYDTILYGIEAKYYSSKPKFIDKSLFKIHENEIFAIGDGAGVTRSLSQAGAMGLYLAETLLGKYY